MLRPQYWSSQREHTRRNCSISVISRHNRLVNTNCRFHGILSGHTSLFYVLIFSKILYLFNGQLNAKVISGLSITLVRSYWHTLWGRRSTFHVPRHKGQYAVGSQVDIIDDLYFISSMRRRISKSQFWWRLPLSLVYIRLPYRSRYATFRNFINIVRPAGSDDSRTSMG